MNQPSLSWLIFTILAISCESSRASIPTISITISAGISISSPESFSLTSISISQPSLGSALCITGLSPFSYIRNRVLASEERR